MAKRMAKSPERKINAKLDLAAPVSARVELKHIILAETLAKRKLVAGGSPVNVSLSVNVNTKVNREQRRIEVFPKFILVARKGDATEGELLRVEALFVLQYEIDSFEGMKKSHIDAFGELNGLYNVWPYWREYVQSTTVRMGFPSLTMPVFRPLGRADSPAKKGAMTEAPRARQASRRVTASPT